MKKRRACAWVLTFLMAISLMMGSAGLKVRAQGTGATVTFNITNNSSFQNGNDVFYKLYHYFNLVTVIFYLF